MVVIEVLGLQCAPACSHTLSLLSSRLPTPPRRVSYVTTLRVVQLSLAASHTIVASASVPVVCGLIVYCLQRCLQVGCPLHCLMRCSGVLRLNIVLCAPQWTRSPRSTRRRTTPSWCALRLSGVPAWPYAISLLTCMMPISLATGSAQRAALQCSRCSATIRIMSIALRNVAMQARLFTSLCKLKTVATIVAAHLIC